MRLNLSSITSAFRSLAQTMLALAAVLFLQVAVAGGSLADGGHHHSDAKTAFSHAVTLAVHAPETVVPAIAVDTASGDCNGNHNKSSSSQKSCCTSTCCAAALELELIHIVHPAGKILSIWAFTAQFVVLKHASGLDRPPDFRA